MEEKKKNTGLIVVIVILVLVIIGMLAFYFFYLKPKTNINVPTNEPTPVEETKPVEEPTPEHQGLELEVTHEPEPVEEETPDDLSQFDHINDIGAGYGTAFKDNKMYLINTEKSKIIKTFNTKLDGYPVDLLAIKGGDEVYFLLAMEDGVVDGSYARVYNKDLEVLLKYSKDKYLIGGQFKADNNGNFVTGISNKITTYNSKGEVVKALTVDASFGFKGGYPIYYNDGKLIVDVDGNEITLLKSSRKPDVDTFFSKMGKLYGKDAIFVYVRDKSATKNQVWNDCSKHDCEFKKKSEIEYCAFGYYYYYVFKTGKTGKIATCNHI